MCISCLVYRYDWYTLKWVILLMLGVGLQMVGIVHVMDLWYGVVYCSEVGYMVVCCWVV